VTAAPTPLTYRDAGVDIDAATSWSKHQALRQAHHAPRCHGCLGGFGAMSSVEEVKIPVKVSGTDGVGTKLSSPSAKEARHIASTWCDERERHPRHRRRAVFFLDYFPAGSCAWKSRPTW